VVIILNGFWNLNTNRAQEASSLVAGIIAQKRKLYSWCEPINARTRCSTINRHTDDMSHDAEEVLQDKLKNNSSSIQVDKVNRFHQ
jgi:hypothetical protein